MSTKCKQNRVLAILMMLCMMITLLPLRPLAATQDMATIEVPISKTVEQEGNVAPEATQFSFGITPYENPDVDISSLTITNNTISTDGVGIYTGTMTITGPVDVIDAAGGLKLTEYATGTNSWVCDTSAYIIWRDLGNGQRIEKDNGDNTDNTVVTTAAFTNVYTETTQDITVTIPISKTVEQLGNVAPEATTFTYEISAYHDTNVDVSGLTITGNTISTDGVGIYSGTMTITGDIDIFTSAGGLKLTEKNENEEYWIYDSTSYIIQEFAPTLQRDPGDNMELEPVDTASFTNAYTKEVEIITFEVPISKTVKQGGSVAPQATTFSFEIAPYGNPDADISGLTISGSNISTNGAGDYSGTLTITGDAEILYNAEGLILTEKNTGVANWTYDTTAYQIWYNTREGALIYKDMGPDTDPQKTTTAGFTNTYTQNTTVVPNQTPTATTAKATNPATGDSTQLGFWISLLLLSCGSVAITCYRKKQNIK